MQGSRRAPGALFGALVAAMVAAVVVLGMVGVPLAGAATGTPTGSIRVTGTAPSISGNKSGQRGAAIVITLPAATALPKLTLEIGVSARGQVLLTKVHLTPTGIAAGTVHVIGSKLAVVLGSKPAGASATIEVSGIEFKTTGATGTVVVTPNLYGVTFSPSSVVDATIVPTKVAPPAISLAASGTPLLSAGETGGHAGTWSLTLTGNSTSGAGWTSTTVVTVSVAPPSGTNCTGNDRLYFAGTPVVNVTSSTGVSLTPTVSASLGASDGCGSSDPNELRIAFTNSGTFDATTMGSIAISVSGIAYTVGPTPGGVGSGAVRVQVTDSAGSATVVDAHAANAMVGGLSLTAGSPPVTVSPSAYDATISPVVVTATTPVPLPAGYLCLTLSGGAFDSSAVPAVTVVSGTETVSSTVTFQGAGPTGATDAVVDVTAASAAGGALSISKLAVDAPSVPGQVVVTGAWGTSTSCAHDTAPVGSGTAFSVARTTVVTQIYGSTSDATAAAELEHQFNAQGTACPGRSGARPVVLATDANFPDALSSAYLAGALRTGELLTPTASLSAVTANAIRQEGITNVYVVGGPLAVSTAVVKQLEGTLAYACGGTSPITAAHPVYLQVTRIFGQTEYGTAEFVAEYPSATHVGTLDVAGAYGKANRTGGPGLYNDTAGTASSAPSTATALPTAIVATGRTFPDAESASVLSYADHLPVLLTTTAALSPEVASAIDSLQIKQVVVMGGPLAVSDAVVTALEALGVSVLRVAGHTATDTAVQLADFEMGPSGGHLGLAWRGTGRVTVARGDYYTDGLAGAVVAAGASHASAASPEPLLLTTGPATAGPYLTAFLERAGTSGIDGIPADAVATLTVLGGPDAVTRTTVRSMRADL